MANPPFIYLMASVIDGYWHVRDMDGNADLYYEDGKEGIDRLIRKYGTDNDGNFNDICFKMFRPNHNVRITNDVCPENFRTQSTPQSTTTEFTLNVPKNEQAVLNRSESTRLNSSHAIVSRMPSSA